MAIENNTQTKSATTSKRQRIDESIDAFLAGEGLELLGREFTNKERERFRNEIYDGTRGNATGQDVSKHIRGYIERIQPLESLMADAGVELSAADRDKFLTRFKSEDLESLRGRASEFLGREASSQDIVKALKSKGFANDPDLYAAHFTRRGQREADIAGLSTQTGGALTAEERAELLDLSDADFGTRADHISRNFTPGEQYTGSAQRIIKDLLGRDASADEISHFGRGLASGQYDEKYLGDMIQQTSEFQDRRAGQARTQLAAESQGIDANYLQRAAQQALAQYASQGRANTSALGAQFAQATTDLGTNRQNFMLGLGAQDYGQNRQREYEQFLGSQGRTQGAYDQSQIYANYMRQQAGQQRTGYLGSSIGQQLGRQNAQFQQGIDQQNFMYQQQAYGPQMAANRRQSLYNSLFQGGAQAIGTYYGMRRG